MKKEKTAIIVVVCILVASVSVIMWKYIKYNRSKDTAWNEVSNYLSENYNENMEITGVSIMDGCHASCNPTDNPDIRFTVSSWGNETYIDTYCERFLAYEATQLIQNQLNNEFGDYDCFTQLLTGPPLELYKKLYDYYIQLNRPLSWQDEMCEEKLSYVEIRFYNDNFEIDDAYKIVEKVKELPIRYNRLVISKNTMENIILEVTD